MAIRDRAAGTTLFVPEVGSSHPAVSDDGCVVAYLVSVPAIPDDPDSVPGVELRAVDRCPLVDGALGPSVLVGTFAPLTAVARPALSVDGAVIVWSTGTGIERYVRFTSGTGAVAYLIDPGFDPIAAAGPLLPAGTVVGADLDASADAEVVAFVAGPGPDPYAPVPPDVYVWFDDPDDGLPPVVELASVRAPAEQALVAAGPPDVDPPGPSTTAGPSTSPPSSGPSTTEPPTTDPPDTGGPGPTDPPPTDPPTTDPPDPQDPRVEGSTDPSLSADGSILVFESADPGLAVAAGAPGLVTPYVVMYHRGAGSAILDMDARRPAISADGHHAVYDHAGVIQSIRWSEGTPFNAIVREVVFGTLDDDPATIWESVTGPLVSANGRAVVFDSSAGAILTDDARFQTGTHVWLLLRPEGAGGPAVDLGSVDVPGSLSGKVTIGNTGSAGIPIAGVTADSPFRITATTCSGVLQPGLTCTVDVAVSLTTTGRVERVVRLAGGSPRTEFAVAVSATGTRRATTPPTVRPPGTVRPPTTTRPSYPTATTRPPAVTTPPTAPPAVPAPAIFNPPTFEFAPTIVGAGRRTAAVDLFNPAREAVTVLAIGIDPAAGSGFSVDPTGCVNQPLASAAACSVGLEFAPIEQGALAATVYADLSDGNRATMLVTGFGAPPPTLTVNPAVAANGQVVSVVGAGFPAGATVELSWDDGRVRFAPVTDEIGGFVETLVVFPNTPGGPSELVVSGQVDLFADVTAELLVSATGSGTGVPVFGGFGPHVAR